MENRIPIIPDIFFTIIVNYFLIPFLLSLALTGFSILLARQFKLLAIPTARSSHTKPTPRIGGLGPVAVIFLMNLFLQNKNIVASESGFSRLLLIGGTVAFLIGLIDDIVVLSSVVKLLGQCLIGLIPILFNCYLNQLTLPLIGTLHLGVLGIPLTFLWLLFFINAFNFMDGMDGKAASFTIIVISAVIICYFVFPPIGSDLMPLLFSTPLTLIIFIGALTGFLLLNYPPARTFMGDCGSHFFGYVLAVIPLCLPINFCAYLILLLPFIYDVVYTLIRRWRRGENLLQAHRSHLYQRLMIIGYSHWHVLRICETTYILCALCSASYLFFQSPHLKLLSLFGSFLTMLIY
ncbi:MAG: hypothetical protein N2246_07410, partial [Candidatus Sumerlaeia bacterium]|nr:hypothetical protein [Candidatus Sumerlaeia bacterium]